MAFWAADVRTCNSPPARAIVCPTPRARRALAAHAELPCPDDGHGDHRDDPSGSDGEAILAGGARARAS
eukprot:15439993-Alexandrium_andersonii.AAC.1